MRLKCIKLAGFKSFVDPTTVHFTANMSAVIGPNGCGKSNIIDAVRWVMGESSAKNLRGDSMTDVIFNGSNTRKPVGQASIELIFDNSDGTLRGEYAQYAEISIRRKVTREAQNTYYLNGVKCRRRDITDIFLGTGLGPRSYSIIEQGMISKLIESKPEELRNYIEEAAGISKYKERRRETENRIRRTQENLARLTDLREELERQLSHLHRQAQAAEKYKEFKAEERKLKAELTALRWQTLQQQVEQRERVIGDQEIALEALIAEQRSADAEIERQRDGHHELSEAFNQAQGRFYSVGSDIARIEQSIQHGQQRLRQLQDDLREAERARSENAAHLGHDETLFATLGEELGMLEPELELAQAASEDSAEQLERAEQAMQQWQSEWDGFNHNSAAPRQQAEVEQARIRHLEQSLERLSERRRRLQDEQQQLATSAESEALAELDERLVQGEERLAELQEQEQACHVQRLSVSNQLEALQREQQAEQNQLQQCLGRIASLSALQQAAREQGKGVQQWLSTQAVALPSLSEQLKVSPGWELAVETVLAADLQALCLDAESLARVDPAALQSGELRLAIASQAPSLPGSLLDKVQSQQDLSAWLGHVLPAESLAAALARRADLPAGASLITQDGFWVGAHFLRVKRGSEAEQGLLARAQQLEADEQQRDGLKVSLERRSAKLEQAREALAASEQEREELRQLQQQVQREQSQSQAQRSALTAKAEQQALRREQLAADADDLAMQREQEEENLGLARFALEQALEHMATDTEQREALLARRDTLREQLDRTRQAGRQHKDHAHQLAVRAGSLKAQYEATGKALERLRQQSGMLAEKVEQLGLNLEEGDEPLQELRMRLEDHLDKRMAVEEDLRVARLALEDADRLLRDAEKRRSQAEQQAQLLRGQLEQQRMGWQGFIVQRDTLQAQLAEQQLSATVLLADMPADADEKMWDDELERLAGRISRLGSINLAAIEEYEQQSERKRYLDAQNADLAEALDTLENVIRKIDRETRQRFKETFDQINAGLQALFPKVFGGGHAYLELTGEDLLDTGVAIMARPPGKKNSTIHLLSGGEKALTAIALVFAIFQLNPAPFCMLDEVDAPLDDANVGRYANIVKEMSDKVQFIYITHNKIAMEKADHLMGVTMHEPGCSRLVTVNVEEAVALVEA
ncbi:chromosome segregation protein SMC [Atopomonas sediminilitoris]|uniref:chromosome segregation protein SMC n=1 Tax=Atopomonas sediminilitoris TaxID=2919919 RepID=UPI001F4EF07E|nr:chromosome segregation protein SMC [Atopomonas sediminilitoris]MCJ8167903.1 chromosome segregation protein SMC [Atopomonas sediminilitoris]